MAPQDDLVITLNRFIQSVGVKGEATVSYAECISALGSISSVNDKSSGREGYDRLLTRLLQHGYIRVSSVEALLSALRATATKDTIPIFTRVLFYLVQLAMGCGAAGTPLPMPANRGNLSLPKAVDSMSPEILSGAWADLSDEKAPFMRKQGAMRALAALALAARFSNPDDPMYPAGLLVTLERLLDTLDQLRAGRNSLASIIAAQAAAEAGAAAKKKNMVAEYKQQMEMQALLRLAFSTARACLSKSGLMQIAQRSFAGVTSPDAVCARHSLALAAMVAKEVNGVTYAQRVGPYLQNNVEMAKRTGVLFVASSAKDKGGAAPPTVLREDTSNYLNLKDLSARIYLARGCAAAIQGGMGDIHGSGSIFWDALTIMGCADPSDLVAQEAIRCMFGAPVPHSEPLRKRPPPSEMDLQDISLQGRILAGSWQMVMSMADNPTPLPERALPPQHPGLAGANDAASAPSQTAGGTDQQPGTTTSLFGRLMSRVLNLLQSRSCSFIAAGARTAAVILEARAWGASYSGHIFETEGVKKSLRVLQTVLMGVFSLESLGAVERCLLAEALVWLQVHPPDDPRQSSLPPQLLLKAASQGGLQAQPVVKALFADPWPEGLVYNFLTTLIRRSRCSPALAAWCCQLAVALAAGTPANTPKDMLLALWDNTPGKDAIRSAVEVMGSPAPPIAQPLAAAQVELKAMAAAEEQAYENLRGTAAWWLGEHANAVAGVSAWKQPAKASVALDFLSNAGEGATQLEIGERLALASQAYAPLLVMAITHLQRHMMTGSYEVKVACAQALSKIAVRSSEPFRIQAYAALRAAAGAPAVTSPPDPLGLAPTILPALEVLDAMYAGQSVVMANVNQYGAEAKAWPPAVLASVRRRHEWLLGVIAQRVGMVPKDVFYPLGRKSRALLNPDDKGEPELLEADEDEKVLDAAAAAAAEGADTAAYDEYADGAYYGEEDPYFIDDAGGGRQYAWESDPLAKWQADQNGNDYGVAAVNWKGVGQNNNSYSAAGGAGDEDDARFGKVQYTFNGVNEDEVSVTAGDRVRVLYNMGDWMQVMTGSGHQGIVPSSYIQVEEGPETSSVAISRQSSMAQHSYATGAGSGYYGQQGGGGDYDGYGQYHDDAYQGYQGYVYDGGAQQDYSLYDQDAENAAYGKGGFDDFGATLLAAAEARQQAQTRATERATQRQEQATLQRDASISSIASTAVSTPMGRHTSTNYALPTAPSNTSTVAGPTLQTSYSVRSTTSTIQENATPTAADSGYGFAKPGGWGGYEEDSSLYQVYDARPAVAELNRVTINSVDDAGAQYGAQGMAETPTSPGAGGGLVAGSKARVVYDFAAETGDELSVGAGDGVEVVAVVEDWLQVRMPDGRMGLVPAAYVQAER